MAVAVYVAVSSPPSRHHCKNRACMARHRTEKNRQQSSSTMGKEVVAVMHVPLSAAETVSRAHKYPCRQFAAVVVAVVHASNCEQR